MTQACKVALDGWQTGRLIKAEIKQPFTDRFNCYFWVLSYSKQRDASVSQDNGLGLRARFA